MKYSPQTEQHGFTLVETLVAITILLLVIIGPMTVAQKGIQNAYYANEQIAATFYAQEAIESVREHRDLVALDAYDDFVSDGEGDKDTTDWMESPELNCSTYPCTRAYDSGEFQTSSQAADIEGTPFARLVTIGTPDADGNVPVTAEVSWQSQVLGAKSVVLQTWIYDHYRRYGN